MLTFLIRLLSICAELLSPSTSNKLAGAYPAYFVVYKGASLNSETLNSPVRTSI